MKYFFLFSFLALVSVQAFAEDEQEIVAIENDSVNASLIDGYETISNTGRLSGTVVSKNVGDGHHSYLVTIKNSAAETAEGSQPRQTFELAGAFTGPAVAVHSRKIDESHYSIDVDTWQLVFHFDGGGTSKKKVKIFLKVTIDEIDVSNIANMLVVDR